MSLVVLILVVMVVDWVVSLLVSTFKSASSSLFLSGVKPQSAATGSFSSKRDSLSTHVERSMMACSPPKPKSVLVKVASVSNLVSFLVLATSFSATEAIKPFSFSCSRVVFLSVVAPVLLVPFLALAVLILSEMNVRSFSNVTTMTIIDQIELVLELKTANVLFSILKRLV